MRSKRGVIARLSEREREREERKIERERVQYSDKSR